MTQTIIETSDLAEACDFDEDEQPNSDMAATEQSDPNAKIEFHVQMKSWTLHDMEALIVEAAAMQTIRSLGDRQFSKLIEERAIAAVTAKADAKIDAVTAEIIDQPLTPNFGEKKPVTMREFIGLYANEYLTQRVDRDGKPSSGRWGSTTFTRAELAVMKAMDAKFKKEIEAAASAAVAEMQRQLRDAHSAMLEQQKARVRDAIAKMTGGES